MRRLVLTMLSLLFVFGCSKGPREKVPVEIDVFSLSQITDAFSGPGNFRMYAKSPSNGLSFSTDMSRYSSTNTELEFGQWELNIIGWDAANYTGNTFCGRSFFNVPEDIVDGKLTITVTPEGCTDGYWSPQEFMTDGQFQKIKISFCESKFELNALTDWNSACQADARSFKIGFMDYGKFPGDPKSIQYSSCVNIDDPTAPLSDMKLPLGNYGFSDIRYVINGYKDPGCNDASTEKIVLPITQGLLSSSIYNNVRIFPGTDALGSPQKEYMSINVNIAFIEQVGMRMSPTKVSLGDRPIPSVFSRTVTVYNESPGPLMNCTLVRPSAADAGGKFSSPDFDANCNPKDTDGLPLGIPNAGTCTFDLVADLNSVTPNVGIKSPIEIQCDGGRYIKTGEDGFLVCPGGNCTNGNFESDLRFRYIPYHLGDVVIGETPVPNNGSNEVEIRNETEDQEFTGCQLSFSGPGVDAFTHGGIIGSQTPAGCLNNLGPMSDCRIQIAPIPTIIGDQEVSVVLSCNEDTVYYLENTTKVTGVHPLEYQGAPFYGKLNNTQDGYLSEIKFRNVGQAQLNNCQVSLSNNTDFQITDMFADGGQMSVSETCGLPGNPRTSMFNNNDECKIGIIPKAGPVGIISTDISLYCSGHLAGSVNYKAERTSSALASIIVDQEASAFKDVEIPYYGDGNDQELYIRYRNNTGGDLYGCHFEETFASSPAASDAIYLTKHGSQCHAKLRNGESCYFKVVPSRFPWEGEGALQVGSHTRSGRLVCDSISGTTVTPVNSVVASFTLNVTDNDAAMSLSPNWHNFGNVAASATAGPITIQVTNTSGATLTSCDAPEFYANGNPTTAFSVSNNTCPLDIAAGSTCSFDVTYTDDGYMFEMSAELELRCDNDKSVRTSSNFVANYSGGGSNNDVNGIYVFGFDNNSQFNEGDVAKMYIYTYNQKIALNTGSPDFSGVLATGNATFNYNAADSTDYRLTFDYVPLADGTHNNDGYFSPTYNSNGAIFTNPDTGINYTNSYFYWDGGSSTSRTIYINQAIPPYVVSVTSPTPDGTYYTGDQILVDVTYSEPVSVQPTYNTYNEIGQINCNAGTNSVNGGSSYYYNNINVGDTVLINMTDEYTVASKTDDDNLTFTTNCTTTYLASPYRLVGPGPEIVFENFNYNGRWHVTYDPAFDANDTDNIVTYRYTVRSDIAGGGFTLGSDGMLNRGVFSVANPTVQAANLTACYDLPDGSCIDKNTNFTFLSKPSISNIYHDWGGGDILPGNNIRFQIMFDEPVQVATVANVKLHFKNDAGTIDSYAELDPTSNNNTSDLYFNWTAPSGFFAADLDIFDYVGFATEITAVDDGQAIASVFPKGTDTNSLQSNHNLRVTQGAPKIIDITSNAGAVKDHPTNIIVTVTFSEPVEVTDPDMVSIELQNDLGGSNISATANTMAAEATNNDNKVAFQVNSMENFYAKDIDVASFSGLSTYVISVESGTYADPSYPQGPNTVGSLSYNKDIQVGRLPEVVSVTRVDANGDLTDPGIQLDIQVSFTDEVNVSGTPQLVINDDNGTPYWYLDYVSGTGTNNLIFSGTTDADIISDINTSDLTLAGLQMNGGDIKDRTNAISYNTSLSYGETFPIGSDPRSLSSNGNILIGGKATITSITANNIPDGVANAFVQGDTIDIHVNFSEAMQVQDAATASTYLVFQDDNQSNINTTYVSGDETSTFVYRLTVPANMNTSDLTVFDFVGLNLIEKVASPDSLVSTNVPKGYGNPNSLASLADIVIGTAPFLEDVNSAFSDAAEFGIGGSLSFAATFDTFIDVAPENHHLVKVEFRDVDNNPVYAILNPTGLPSNQLSFDFSIPPRMDTTDLTVNTVHGLQYVVHELSKIPTTVTDATWPKGQGTPNSLANNKNFIVGGPAPTIVSMIDNASNGTFSSGQLVSMIVNFDIPVNIDSEDVNFVKLELTDDNANIAYATLNGFTSPATQAYFDFVVPNQGFETADLTVTGFIGMEHVYNPLSGITLDLASAPFGGVANSLQANSAIVIQEIPKIASFEVLSTPANGTYYQAPTDAGDELRIAVNFTKPVEVDAGNETSPYIQIKNQDSTQYADGYIETASLSDGDPNQIIFSFTLPQTFTSNDIDVWSLYHFNSIEIPATAMPVDFDNYPTGSTAGSLMANSDVEVRNEVKVLNITSDAPDGIHPDPSLHVRVQFSTPVTVQDIDLNDVFLRANGDNGSFAIAKIDTTFKYTGTYELVFRFDFPDEFQTNELMINFAGGFNMIVRPGDLSEANVIEVPNNGVPNSLAANKNIQIQQKDPMTVYGSGVDGDIAINETVELSARQDIVKDIDNQSKYGISFFRIRGLQYQTTPQPHHVITIQPGDAVNYRQFQQADGDPNTVTTLEQNDIVMWYVNSERGNACGNTLSPGMFGFLAAHSFISATQARFGSPPGTSAVSIMGGAFLPASGLPGTTPLSTAGDSTEIGVEISGHCNMQLVRVFMPRVLQLGTAGQLMASYYNEYTGLGGILPVKIKEVLDLMGKADASPNFELSGSGFPSTGYAGFSGHSGWHNDLFTSFDQSGGLSQANELGGGGAGWRDGGNHSSSASSGGVAPETTYCAGNCYPGSNFNQVKYAFMGSAGASFAQESSGGGVLVLHAKKIENGNLNINANGVTTAGGGAGGGTVYLDFNTVNQFSAPANDVVFNVYANGSAGELIDDGQESGGGGGGHINIQVCNNKNTTNASNILEVLGGIPEDYANPGVEGLKYEEGLNPGGSCLSTLPQ